MYRYRQKFGDFWKHQDVSSQINKESLKFYFKMPKILRLKVSYPHNKTLYLSFIHENIFWDTL